MTFTLVKLLQQQTGLQRASHDLAHQMLMRTVAGNAVMALPRTGCKRRLLLLMLLQQQNMLHCALMV
jgi:hypothetical protein